MPPVPDDVLARFPSMVDYANQLEGIWGQIQMILGAAHTQLAMQVNAGTTGTGDMSDDLLECQTEMVSKVLNTIAGNATVTLAPTISGNRLRRKSIILSNGDSANRLNVIDVDGGRCPILFPETNICLTVSGTIKVYNPNSFALEFYATEIYWVTTQKISARGSALS